MISSSSLSVMVSKSANVSVWDIDGLRGKHRRQLTHKMCPKHFHNLWWIKVKKKRKTKGVSPHTWFLSDMRKSSLEPGSPSSMKVFTSRRSALLPGSRIAGYNDSVWLRVTTT